jgi:hypothetical protein
MFRMRLHLLIKIYAQMMEFLTSFLSLLTIFLHFDGSGKKPHAVFKRIFRARIKYYIYRLFS